MKYLVVIEYDSISPVVVSYDILEYAEDVYNTTNSGKRVTMFELVNIGLTVIYKEMKTRTQL